MRLGYTDRKEIAVFTGREKEDGIGRIMLIAHLKKKGLLPMNYRGNKTGTSQVHESLTADKENESDDEGSHAGHETTTEDEVHSPSQDTITKSNLSAE
jgi:hypothetical protein